MNIYERLEQARDSIRSSKVKKDGHNTYSKYDYFTPEQVEALVMTACKEVKALCLTNLKADQFGLYQELEFINMEDTTDRLVFHLRTAEADMTATNRAQKMGGTDTYSERYIKMKVFQIKDNNLDFDSQDNRVTKPTAYQAKKAAVETLHKKETYQTEKQAAELDLQVEDDLS